MSQVSSLAQPDGITPQQRRSLLAQIALTIFVGIPMTIALGLALVAYFTYEFAKMRITGKPPLGYAAADTRNHESAQALAISPQTSVAEVPSLREEASFSTALSNLAKVHGPARTVISNGNPVVAEEVSADRQGSAVGPSRRD